MNIEKRLCLVLLGALLAAPLVGCAPSRTYAFNVTVENKTDQLLTVFLIKDGPPVEKGWMSPENMVMQRRADDDSIANFALEVPPGRTLYGKRDVTGKFEPNTIPILRIYRGRFKGLSELLAVSSSSPDFLEITLPPGPSTWTISNGPDGRMSHTGTWEKK